MNSKQWARGHLLLVLSCALLLWSVWLGDVRSDESSMGSVSERAGPLPGVLASSSRDTSSSGRETHLRLLPNDDCTPKTKLVEFWSKRGGGIKKIKSRNKAPWWLKLQRKPFIIAMNDYLIISQVCLANKGLKNLYSHVPIASRVFVLMLCIQVL